MAQAPHLFEVQPDGEGSLADALPVDADRAAALLAAAASMVHASPPSAPAPQVLPTTLDRSAWPIVHGSRQSQDSSGERQPTGSSALNLYNSQSVSKGEDQESMAQLLVGTMIAARRGDKSEGFALQAAKVLNLDLADANPVSIITQKGAEGSQILWTSAIGNVLAYREKDGKKELEKLAAFNKGMNMRFHGSYAFVGKTGNSSGFFTTDDDAIMRYELRGSDKAGWSIQQTGTVSLPHWANPKKDDHLVGISVLDDGSIVVGSKNGVVMAAGVDSKGGLQYVDAVHLSSNVQTSNTHVSNSISSDGQAVFVVTQREIVRFDLRSGKFVFKWSSIYGEEVPWYVGRLGPGSGSTPTVTTCGGRSLVVITDGALPMNLLWYDAETGGLVARKRVQFGSEEEGSAPTTSEQSVAVDGCRAFVVQNYMGTDELSTDTYCTSAEPGSYAHRRLSSFCANLMVTSNSTDMFVSKACPAALGCMSMGAALFEVQPDRADAEGRMLVQRAWTRDDVSCGTSIPLISTHQGSRIVYCAGTKKGSPLWSLVGLDLSSGKDVVVFEFYKKNRNDNFFANPFYAGVEAVGPDKVAIGSIGGVIYLSPASTTTSTTDKISATANRWLEALSSNLNSTSPEVAAFITAPADAKATMLLAAPVEVKASLFAVLLLAVALAFACFRRRTVDSPRLPLRAMPSRLVK